MADIFLAINQHLMVIIRRADTNGQLLRYLLETYGYEGEIHVHSGLTRLPHTGSTHDRHLGPNAGPSTNTAP